jgi:hypothetical protein
VLQRFIAASAPALVSCNPVLDTPQQCGGGTWTFSIKVTPPGAGSPSYASLAAARAGAPQGIAGWRLEVTTRGSVSLLEGFQTGAPGMSLGQIGVQGDAVMAVL